MTSILTMAEWFSDFWRKRPRTRFLDEAASIEYLPKLVLAWIRLVFVPWGHTSPRTYKISFQLMGGSLDAMKTVEHLLVSPSSRHMTHVRN